MDVWTWFERGSWRSAEAKTRDWRCERERVVVIAVIAASTYFLPISSKKHDYQLQSILELTWRGVLDNRMKSWFIYLSIFYFLSLVCLSFTYRNSSPFVSHAHPPLIIPTSHSSSHCHPVKPLLMTNCTSFRSEWIDITLYLEVIIAITIIRVWTTTKYFICAPTNANHSRLLFWAFIDSSEMLIFFFKGNLWDSSLGY